MSVTVLLRLAFGAVLTAFGACCLVAGVYEVLAKRRPPGRLFGRGIFPRDGPQISDAWTPDEWRRGGVAVSLLGAVLTVFGVSVLIS